MPGVRENGGQYTHGVLFFVRALAEMGRGTRAVELLRDAESRHAHGDRRADRDLSNRAVRRRGRRLLANRRTSAAAAGPGTPVRPVGCIRVAVESILGLSIEGGQTLVLRPAISSAWPSCRLNYRLPDGRTRYEITIENPDGKETGVTAATLDGEPAGVVDGAARIELQHGRRNASHRVVVRVVCSGAVLSRLGILVSSFVFPPDFVWGAATSAYQIEGSPLADGAGPSIWHRFTHTPGKIEGGDNGDVACDHYRRFADDVRLMRELGLQSYRFSTAWGRVLPEGTGRPNRAGLDFYSRLVDTLLGTRHRAERDALPLGPAGRARRPRRLGPCRRTEVVRRIRAADVSHARRPRADVGHAQRTVGHDGQRLRFGQPRAGPTRLGGGGQGFAEFAAGPCRGGRRLSQPSGKQQIGLVVNLVPVHPATDTAADRAAAKRMDAYLNRQFLDPALLGEFPEEMSEMFGEAWPAMTADEVAAAAAADRLRRHQLLPAALRPR